MNNYLLVLMLSTFLVPCWSTGCNSAVNSKDIVLLPADAKRLPELTPDPASLVVWKPASYRGLVPGKSRYEDVKRIFGEPRWEGENEDKDFEDDAEFEILLQYLNQGVGREAADVLVGSKTRIVKAISYLPDTPLTKQEAIARFGNNYFEIGSGKSLCVDNDLKKTQEIQKDFRDFPIFLVYPDKGMYVSILQSNIVNQVGFLYKCH